jgi:hypothetical protein
MQPKTENCENCGRAIGRLEQPYVWQKHVVCAACHAHLSSAPATPARTAGNPRAKHPEYHRPAADAPPLPLSPPPPVVPTPGHAADPFAVKPDAPAQGPPMFMCSECGHSFNFDDITSDHGRLVCRACALKVAAQRRAQPRKDPGEGSPVLKFVLIGVGLAAVAAVVFGVYTFLDSAFSQQKLASTDRTEQVEAPRGASPVAPEQVAPAVPDATPQTAPSQEPPPGELFPNVPEATDARPTEAPATAAPDPWPTVAEAPRPQAPVEMPAPKPSPSPAPPSPLAEKPAGRAPAPPAAPPEPPKGTAQWHVHRGRELLTQGKARASIEEFGDAARLDKDCADAFHGIGLAYAQLGDTKLSIERLEKAVSLYDPPNRAAVYNLAAAHLKNNPMRAAKLARDYLSRPDSQNDEEMHNLMGAALWRVDAQGRQNRAFTEAENFYFAYNARLETGRPDERKRWGTEWVSAPEAARKWNDYKGKRQNVERLRLLHGRAAKAAKDAHNKVYEYASDLKLHSEMEKKRVRQNYERAVKQVDDLRQKVLKAEQEFAYAEKPPLPQVVPLVPMDPVAAAPAAEATNRRTTGS